MSAAVAALSLAQRELVRFVRQPSRIAGALGPPLLFWIVLGSGLSSSFELPGVALEPAAGGLDYLTWFFPGTLALVVLFASIFSAISVIEDRNEGFLQGVLVAPVPRSAVVAGKVLGGASQAFLQGLLFLLIAPLAGLVGGGVTVGGLAFAAGVLALISLALTAFGFAFAWKIGSVQGFHAVMSLLLLPMWLLSGAFFPLTGAPGWLQLLMTVNPLTYGVAALRHGLTEPGVALPGPSPAVALGVTVAFAVVTFAAGVAVARGRRG